MFTRLAPGAIFVLGLWAATAAGREPSLGEKIVDYCKSHKGQQVDRGECYDLAHQALRSAGAKTGGKDSPGEGDYTWGDLILVLESAKTSPKATQGKLGDVRPGDILQFRDAKFEGPLRGRNGRYATIMDHHTAVVSGVERQGKVVKIYQQNHNGKRVVLHDTLYTDDLKQGWMRVYRPVADAAEK